MGARAHYIRRSAGSWRLRYSQWGAETIDRDIFWGPGHTGAFVDAQVERGADDWLDEVWCEGAVLMDEDHRQLLFFGGEMASGVLTGPTYTALLGAVWEGWDVRPSTLREIAAALDVDQRLVAQDDEPEPIAPDWETLHAPPADDVIAEVRAYLLAETGTDPVALRARFEARDGAARFAPHFDTPVHLRLGHADRVRILDAAIASLGVEGRW